MALNLSVDVYIKRLPPLSSLLLDYHIHADVAFFLARPMFAHSINSKYDELRRAEKNSKNLLPAQKVQKYLEVSVVNNVLRYLQVLNNFLILKSYSRLCV